MVHFETFELFGDLSPDQPVAVNEGEQVFVQRFKRACCQVSVRRIAPELDRLGRFHSRGRAFLTNTTCAPKTSLLGATHSGVLSSRAIKQ
jgi:hypothetical protein